MGKETSEKTRGGRVLSHLRHNVVGYVALFIAVSMTPLPSYAAGLIGTADIKDGAVTTAKLHSNAVKSGKITDGQVKKVDIAAGARGYTSIKTVVATTDGVASAASSTKNVDCGVGKVAIGGGGYVVPPGVILIGSTTGHVVRSHPVNLVDIFGSTYWVGAGNATSPRGWRTTVENTTAEARTAYFYAICASK
jgi:hypothetical protein